MENYFNYFTEIEEHFQQRRGSVVLLSPLDWSLIESFQTAGIPLDVVLRGIDLAFEKHAKRKSQVRKVNSLAYCTQSILAEFERQRESAVGKGAAPQVEVTAAQASERDNLLQLLDKASDRLKQSRDQLAAAQGGPPVEVLGVALLSLGEIRSEATVSQHLDYEKLELRLTTLEEKIMASMVSSLGEDLLLAMRTEVNQEINRHRRDLKAEQIAMLEKKMLQKRLFEKYDLPRLSLFYLPLN